MTAARRLAAILAADVVGYSRLITRGVWRRKRASMVRRANHFHRVWQVAPRR